MRGSIAAIVLCGCGTLASGPGAPSNEPSSGLGPATAITDQKGLKFTPPFILVDPSTNFSHASVIADGKQLDAWVESEKQGTVTIAHAHADAFEDGFGDTELALAAALPWEGGAVGTPATLRRDHTLILYVASGQVGVARIDDGARAPAPLFGAGVASLAAGLDGDTVHVVTLTGGQIEERTCSWAALEAAVSGAAPAFTIASDVAPVPTYGTAFETVGLRIDKTPAGRMREDLFFSVALPLTAAMQGQDLGSAAPTAGGAASRYLADGTGYADVALPILSGAPYPSDPTAIGYQGGVLVFYTAQSTRRAIAVARHP